MRPTRAHIRVAVASTALALGACASAPVVPVRGTPDAVASLAGEWSGTYTSRTTGRSGSIWFKLIEGEDHAHGDVLMTPEGARHAYRRDGPDPSSYSSGQRSGASTFLTIRFVRAADGVIDGVLDPYWDSACDCHVLTAFRGSMLDDRITGTFVSRFGSSIATGRWDARRTSEDRDADGADYRPASTAGSGPPRT